MNIFDQLSIGEEIDKSLLMLIISCQWDKLSVALTLVTVFINTCCKPGLLQNSPISPRRRCAECGQ